MCLHSAVSLLEQRLIGAHQAVQFLRGRVPEELDGDSIQWSFYQMYNSFLSVYIIFTSEGWIDIMFPAVISTTSQGWITAIFLSGWFLLANFVLLQLFIALLNEGFAIAEEDKSKAQQEAYAKRFLPAEKPVGWVTRWNPYRLLDRLQKKQRQRADVPPMALVSNPLTERYRPPDQNRPAQDASFVGALKRTVKKRDKHSREASEASRGVDAQLYVGCRSVRC